MGEETNKAGIGQGTAFGKGDQPSWIIGGSPISGTAGEHSTKQPGAPDAVPSYVPLSNPWQEKLRAEREKSEAEQKSAKKSPAKNESSQVNFVQRLIDRFRGR